MTNSKIQIVPATVEMFERFVGEAPQRTVRAVAVVRDDEVLGIAGVCVDKCRLVMFSELSDELKKNKRAIARGIRALMRIAGRFNLPIYAVADKTIEGSDKLLEHLRFQKTVSGVYVWRS